MTDPTPLSPAAQAVLDAFTEDNSLHDWKHNYYNIEAVAVALRAAAHQMRFSDRLGLTGFEGYVQALDQIFSIADELEGAQ